MKLPSKVNFCDNISLRLKRCILLTFITVFAPAKYESVTSLKANRPQLKVLLTLRVDDASPAFVSGGEAQLEGFCNNTVAFLRHHNFDGLDVEWKVAESSEVYLRLFQVRWSKQI